jgi:hypothetical protein
LTAAARPAKRRTAQAQHAAAQERSIQIRAQNRRLMIDESVPKSLAYALQDKAAMQVAYVRVEQHDMHIVVEPGHDSELIWKGLIFLLKIEGLTDGESSD